jgi:hypothetical protein
LSSAERRAVISSCFSWYPLRRARSSGVSSLRSVHQCAWYHVEYQHRLSPLSYFASDFAHTLTGFLSFGIS